MRSSYIKSLLRKDKKSLVNKRGSELVEAAIVMPILIISVILLLRLFTFYLQILDTGLKMHEEAIEKCIEYDDGAFKIYSDEKSIEMLKGQLLESNMAKHIKVKAYLINEDALVRAGEILE